MQEVTVKLRYDLPSSIRAYSTVDADDNCYIIIINESLCEEARREALEHELQHIERDDFFSEKPLDEIEGCDPEIAEENSEGQSGWQLPPQVTAVATSMDLNKPGALEAYQKAIDMVVAKFGKKG